MGTEPYSGSDPTPSDPTPSSSDPTRSCQQHRASEGELNLKFAHEGDPLASGSGSGLTTTDLTTVELGPKAGPKAVLDDLSEMPFGKYKGTPMQDVPANYLHWLWTNGKSGDRRCPVADYIRHNLAALKLEYPDGLW